VTSRLFKEIMRMLGVLAGTTVLALSLVLFLIPNKIAPGGVSGLATVVYHLSGLSVGLVMLLINIPLFLLGIKKLGFVFGLRSLVATIYLSFAVDILQRYVSPVTQDPLLAALYGGIIMGVGLGIAITNGGTTGGTDLAAVLVHRFLGLSVGATLLVIDAIVIVIAGFFFSLELAMYSALALFVATKLLDLMQEGWHYARAAYIISDKSDDIAQAIMTKMERGVTGFYGKGMYSGKDKNILYVICSRSEIATLKDLVRTIDKDAFIVIGEATEVLGEGFRANKGTNE
jgi:uncharacterized membrane-anchored protein YitT (DUF2179 family)